MSTTDSYTIGEGVRVAMSDAGDVPRSDEMYFTSGVSQTVGRDALYYYIQEDNTTRRVPFE